MRGAAMKVGQLLAMDAGEFLPSEWEPILAQLRQSADAMPKDQLLYMLNTHWGKGWMDGFSHFSFEPIASASIGQVHKATLVTGETLAVKIQYPGIVESIDSDVNNVGRLIKLTNALPEHFPLNELLEDAKTQLKEEADYTQEAQNLARYTALLNTTDNAAEHFIIPTINDNWSNTHILAMEFVEGETIDILQYKSLPERSAALQHLLDLTLTELFEFGFMQTDPNFANYLYEPQSQKWVLLDFGACMEIPEDIQAGYRQIAKGMLAQDKRLIQTGLLELRLLLPVMPEDVVETVLNAALTAAECLQKESYNLAQYQLIQRLYEQTTGLMRNKDAIGAQTLNAALVNRKITGVILLLNKFKTTQQFTQLVKRFC
jgi:predicted unusual protein kinase regulating ubiquinone biosynthesis (AarF/ABC1/UbiB family)